MAGFLQDLTAPDAADRLTGSTVLLPIGAVEQHGPHLPLSTDHVIATEAAKAVVERLGDELDLLALPPLAFSKSNEHAWSKGTIWLSADTLNRVLDDVARCVAEGGAARLVFLNGHGGNSTLLNVACREIRLTHGLLTFLVHPFPPPAYSPPKPDAGPSSELGMGIHGGLDETAVMLHLAPDTVEMSRAEPNVPEWMTAHEHVRFGGSVQFGWLSDDFGTAGHIGDPTGATAEYGARLFEASVDLLCDQLREICAFDFPDRSSGPARVHRVVDPAGIGPPAANYAHARLTDGARRSLHTSGVVPIAPDGSVPSDPVEQAEVVWTNIAAMLDEAGLAPADIVSVTTYATPGLDLAPIMAARDRALAGHLAASTLVVVPELARPEWLLEIAVVAHAP